MLKNREICKFHGTDFFNRESTYDLKDVLASIYDRKTAIRRFDTINDILRPLSLVQSLLKGRNLTAAGTNAYETVGNRRVK